MAQKPIDIKFSQATVTELNRLFDRAFETSLRNIGRKLNPTITLHGQSFGGSRIPVDQHGFRAPGPYLPKGVSQPTQLFSRDAGEKVLRDLSASFLRESPKVLDKLSSALAKDASKTTAAAIKALFGDSLVTRAIALAMGEMGGTLASEAVKSLKTNLDPRLKAWGDAIGKPNASGGVQASEPAPAPDMPVPQSAVQRLWNRATGRGGGGKGNTFLDVAKIIGADRGISAILSNVQSAFAQATSNIEGYGALYKYAGGRGNVRNYMTGLIGTSDSLGYTDDQTLAFSRSLLGGLRAGQRNPAGQVYSGLAFASAYGLDPTQYGATLSSFGNQTGYLNNMSVAGFQGLMAGALGQTKGSVRMDDFLSGLQSISQTLVAQNLGTPNLNGLLGLYTSLNASGNPGLRGTGAAQVMSRMSAGMAALGSGGDPATRAFAMQALSQSPAVAKMLGIKTGAMLSPAQYDYVMSQGLGGPGAQALMHAAGGMYKHDNYTRWMVEGQLFGLNPYQMSKVEGSMLHPATVHPVAYHPGGIDTHQRIMDTEAAKAFRKTAMQPSMQTMWQSMKDFEKNLGNLSDFLATWLNQHKGLARALPGLAGAAGLIGPLIAHVPHAITAASLANRVRTWVKGRGSSSEGEAPEGAMPEERFQADARREAKNGYFPARLSPQERQYIAEQRVRASQVESEYVTARRSTLNSSRALRTRMWRNLLGNGKAPAELQPDMVGRQAMTSEMSRLRAYETSRLARELHPFGETGDMGGFGLDPMLPFLVLDQGVPKMPYPKPGTKEYAALQKSSSNPLGLGSLWGGITSLWGDLFGDGNPPSTLTSSGIGGASRGRGGSFTQIAQQHSTAISDLLLQHDKNASDSATDQQHRVLAVTVLETNAKRQILTDSQKFTDNISTALANWITASMNASGAAMAQGFSGGSPGGTATGSGFGLGNPSGGIGGWTGGGGGVNTFAGFGKGLSYGADAHVVLPGGIEDYERGQIFGAATGTPIRLPQGAKYDRNLSDQYRSIFTLPNGHALSFMHGDMNMGFKNGQYLAAGTIIGTVAPNGGPNGSVGSYVGTTPGGIQTTYMSTPDIVEFGVYDNAQDAFKRNVPFSHTYDPNQYLASLGQGGKGGSAPIMIRDRFGNAHTVSGALASYYRAAAAKYGEDPRILAAQGYNESGWSATATSGAGALGIAQFMPATGHAYGLYGNDFFNPQKEIMAQAAYMNDLSQQYGGMFNALRYYHGIGSDGGTTDVQYANMIMQGALAGKGGSSSVAAMPPIVIKLVEPMGTMHTITIKPKKTFQGVAGVTVANTPEHHGGDYAAAKIPMRRR